MALETVPTGTKKVLVVDDQPDVREALRLVLKGAGYLTDTAASPGDALAATASGDPDLIVADMNYSWDTTSGEEGLLLLDRLRAQRRDLPIIAMTGWGSIELAVHAMQRGACDFIPKPWDNRQLLSAVEKHIRVRRDEHDQWGSDLALARKVQRKLLPQPHFSAYGLECDCVSIPLQEVGGDLYDFIALDSQRLAVVLGDVSGKGIGAALLVANLQATIRAHTKLAASPGELMECVNQLFFESTRPEFFATVFFAVYDAGSKTLRYVNCGHPAPVLLRGTGKAELLEPTSIVLGAFKGSSFEDRTIPFEPGDRLVAFSDGFSELEMDGEDPNWASERVQRIARMNVDGLASALASLAVKTAQQKDDLTVLDIRCIGLKTSQS